MKKIKATRNTQNNKDSANLTTGIIPVPVLRHYRKVGITNEEMLLIIHLGASGDVEGAATHMAVELEWVYDTLNRLVNEGLIVRTGNRCDLTPILKACLKFEVGQ